MALQELAMKYADDGDIYQVEEKLGGTTGCGTMEWHY